jgi:hypothetical protein
VKVKLPPYIQRDARVTPDGVYRYDLQRYWSDRLPTALWVMLNPSKADHLFDDPTIRKVRGFTHRWGLGGFVVVNLFSLRSTYPEELGRHAEPVGRFTDETIKHWANGMTKGSRIVMAWGAHGGLHGRDEVVTEILASATKPTYVLGWTKGGQPLHPLMQPYALEPRQVY